MQQQQPAHLPTTTTTTALKNTNNIKDARPAAGAHGVAFSRGFAASDFFPNGYPRSRRPRPPSLLALRSSLGRRRVWHRPVRRPGLDGRGDGRGWGRRERRRRPLGLRFPLQRLGLLRQRLLPGHRSRRGGPLPPNAPHLPQRGACGPLRPKPAGGPSLKRGRRPRRARHASFPDPLREAPPLHSPLHPPLTTPLWWGGSGNGE
mmetsp:Transcript_38697/g.86416  ORF Transcript_38697/g.86416 Transcript_38697/m.86416 type:complete len:204 (-) Transcript_38697:457-1068(-)